MYAAVPSVPPVPIASVLPSVPVSVRVLLAVKVLPSATASVLLVAGAVIAILLMLVAVATPRTGVTRVGVLAKTKAPVPVSSLTTPANSADVVAANAERLSDVVARTAEAFGTVRTLVCPEVIPDN